MSRFYVTYHHKVPHHIHSLRSSCFTKMSAFNVAGNLVMVVKFTFQSVFGNSPKSKTLQSARSRRSHSSCILSFDLIGQHQNKRFYVTEIVWLLGFSDAIFRRERSDDRKCVCCSQATQIWVVLLIGHLHNDVILLLRPESFSFFLSYLHLVIP